MSSSLPISSPFFGRVGFNIDDIIEAKNSVSFGIRKSHEFSFATTMMMNFHENEIHENVYLEHIIMRKCHILSLEPHCVVLIISQISIC